MLVLSIVSLLLNQIRYLYCVEEDAGDSFWKLRLYISPTCKSAFLLTKLTCGRSLLDDYI